MAEVNGPPPKVVFIGGKRYMRVACLVHTKQDHPTQGERPKLMGVIWHDEKVELAGGEEFVVAYLQMDD
jgi:hypothetical protein